MKICLKKGKRINCYHVLQETQGSKRISLMASKPPSNANKSNYKKSLKRNLEDDSDALTNKSKRSLTASKRDDEDDDSEFGSEELSDEELDEMSGDDEVGPAIEEPTLYVQGEGSGAANKCENTLWPDFEETDENDIGEAIEEEVFFVFGEGSGYDCDVGNNDVNTTESPACSTAASPAKAQSKPMFFFGQAGCLKLSPMKTVTTDNAGTTPPSSSEETPSTADENINNTNDTNSVALDANQTNTANNDETDKGVSIVNEPHSLSAPQNNANEDKIEKNTESSNDLPVTAANDDAKETTVNASENVPTLEQLDDISSDPFETDLSNTTVENECSKENIESKNSSVALESISVQEEEEKEQEKPNESESIEQESQPASSSVLKIESHLTNDEVQANEISNKCEEQKTPELEATDDASEISKSEPENKVIDNSEIVNESNVVVKENKNENQSSLSEANVQIATNIDDTPTSSEKNEIDEQTKTSEHLQDLKDSQIAKKSDDEQDPIVQSEQKTTSEGTNELDYESNSDVKTESLNEQNESTINNIQPVETQLECGSSQNIPTDNSTPVPSQSETTNELLNDLPNDIVETNESLEEKQAAPTVNESKETNEIKETHTESAPTTTNEVKPEIEKSVSVPESIENAESKENVMNEQESIAPVEKSSSKEELTTFVVEVEEKKSVDPVQTETEITQSTSSKIQSEAQPIEEVKQVESVPISATEKRKSSDEDEFTECKKICEEKLPIEPQEPTKIEVNAVIEQKVDEVPLISHNELASKSTLNAEFKESGVIEATGKSDHIDLVPDALENDVSAVKSDVVKPEIEKPTPVVKSGTTSTESTVDVSEKIELSNIVADNVAKSPIESTILPEEKSAPVLDIEQIVAKPATELANSSENLSESIPEKQQIEATQPLIETPNKDSTAPISQNEQSAAVNLVENSDSNQEKKTNEIPATAPTVSSQRIQLRTRKRRISSEKLRHSSESDDNTDAVNESPLSRDVSDSEEVGGKRIKMRPKVVKRNVRRSVEQKRNIKDTDWSSDDNEKPNAKRATSDLLKSTENILPSPEKTVPKEESKSSVKAETEGEVAPSADDTLKLKQEEEERQSDDEQGKMNIKLSKHFFNFELTYLLFLQQIHQLDVLVGRQQEEAENQVQSQNQKSRKK